MMDFKLRSIASRTLVLVIVSVVVCAIAAYFALRAARVFSANAERADYAISLLRATSALLARTPESERRALLDALNRDSEIRFYPASERAQRGREPRSPLFQHFEGVIREALGNDPSLRITRAPGPLWSIGFSAGGAPWIVEIPSQPLERMRYGRWFLGMFAAIPIVLLLALGYVWSLTRPLRAISEATARVSEGHARTITPSGPRELQDLAVRFNGMVEALDRNARERRVMLEGLPHDLRGPLARMRLRIGLIDDAELREGLSRDAAEIERITRQFIGYATGNDDEPWVRVPLADFVHEVAGEQGEASGKITVTVQREPSAEIKPLAMKRVLANLIDNALTHGAAPVEITLDQRGEEAIIEVTDHGPGIAPADQARALEPFTRLDGARGAGGSCGLGLAIVDRIVRAHGGRLTLANAPGAGLRVSVHLPLEHKRAP